MKDCLYSVRKNRGLTQWFECKIDNEICPFTRRCPNLNQVINTPNFINCVKLLKEKNKD